LPESIAKDDDRLFPSRLVQRSLLAGVVELLQKGSGESPSMAAIRDQIEKVTGRFAESKELKHVEGTEGIKGTVPGRLSLEAKRQVRRMMSRYWANSSPFALDLIGAVLRQGFFIEKMIKVSSLCHPLTVDTMLT